MNATRQTRNVVLSGTGKPVKPGSVGRILYELSIEVRGSVGPPDRTALAKRTLCAVDPSASFAETISASGSALQCDFTPRRHELSDKRLARRGREGRIG